MTVPGEGAPKPYENQTVKRIQEKLGTKKTVAGIVGLAGVAGILALLAASKIGDNPIREHAEFMRLAAEVEKTEKETLEKRTAYESAKKAEEMARAALQKYLGDLKKKYEKKNGNK